MRKDRRGIAITKGAKKHKITFRDEVPEEASKAKEEAIFVHKSQRLTEKLASKSMPVDSSAELIVGGLRDNTE